MSFMEELIILSDIPVAKTNILDIQGDLITNINQLLGVSDDEVNVTYNMRRFKRESKESNETLWKRIHREIKQLIRKELGLPDNQSVYYEISHVSDSGHYKVYFFYIAPKKENIISIDELTKESVSKDKIFQALIGLHLKRAFIAQVQEYYEFEPEYFNSKLYLGAELKSQSDKEGKVKVDALYPEIYFSNQNELIVTIHRKSFKSISEAKIVAEVDDNTLVFRNSKGTFKVTEDIDARKYSKKMFMTFDEGYRYCINHAQNSVMSLLKQILSTHEISYKERTYQANYALDNFLKTEKKIKKPLVVIDNLGDCYTTEERKNLYEQLENEYPSSEFAVSSQFESLDNFTEEKSYLVLNRSHSRNGSSVMVGDVKYNTFWDAYRLYKPDEENNLDYYSKIKFDRFESNRPVVLQGLNVERLTKESMDKETGKKYESYKPISKHKLNRIQTELWLKEGVIINRQLTDITLPKSNLTLIYVRKPKSNNKRLSFFGSVVDVELTGSELNIQSQQIFKTEQRLFHHCPYLKNRKLYNDAFYIFDKDGQVFLSAYHSSRVPEIIGNIQVDNIATAEANNDKLRRLTAINECPLPYYLLKKERKQYHHIYLQELENDLLCFVSRLNSVQQKIEKQNLIYNILTFDTEGNLLKALDQRVTEIYLKSFTEDILRVNEVSKSSLLEKVARLYIEN